MNMHKFPVTLLIILSTTLWSLAGATQSGADLKTEALIIAKKFGGELKPQLKSALQSGGPLKAIEICASEAPAIAEKLSKTTGWTVKRVSLKPRNSKTAVADRWEQEVLKTFEKRLADGEPVSQLVYDERIANRYRLMKAQAVEPICLACHGSHLAPEVEQALERYYPHDKAKGYRIGQIRGAFSLARELPENPPDNVYD